MLGVLLPQRKKRYDCIVVHYGEIGVRKRNRGDFVRALRNNVVASLKGKEYAEVQNINDRLIVRLSRGSELGPMLDAISCVFGVSWFAPAIITSNSLDKITDGAIAMIKASDAPRRLVANRSIKDVPFTSDDIVHQVLIKRTKMKLNIDKDAASPILINVTKEGTIICDGKIKGLGGLPVGTSGRAIVLLSGGIDSPVAAFYAMKRGLAVSYLHMHMFSSGEEASKGKIKGITELLLRYSGNAKVYYVPSHPFLSYMAGAPQKYELILFKRFLLDLASKMARDCKADVIITGESLGQVASQTLSNLISESNGIGAFVLRPLIGFDKQEIIDVAKRIGTYELSIRKYKDVCSITTPNPPTGTKADAVASLYKKSGLDKAVKITVSKIYEAEAKRKEKEKKKKKEERNRKQRTWS
jgi:thiamine biosynthesis protein ThiI